MQAQALKHILDAAIGTFRGNPVMRLLFLFLATLVGCIAADAQDSQFGPQEHFGTDGRLFSSERSGLDTIRFFILYKRALLQIPGMYDGQLRKERDVPGGGYASEGEFDFIVNCGEPLRDYEENVTIFDMAKRDLIQGSREQAERSSEWDFRYLVDRSRTRRPPGSELRGYNLWWAVCRGQFQKFK